MTTRRGFLKASAYSLGAVALTPAFLRAYAARPNEQVRIGAIGVGGQGKGNMNAHIKNVVAVAEVDKDRLAAAAAQVEKGSGQTPKTFNDYRHILERKDVDAVVITTPDHWHALPTIHACQAGKDVYVEKPLSLTVVEGRAMTNAARKHKRIVQTGSQQRSSKEFRQAAEIVRNGLLGKLQVVKVGIPGVNFKGPAVADSDPPANLDYDLWLGPAPLRKYNEKRVHYNFRFFWEYSGGQMTNWGAHHLDIVQWALGMDASGPISVTGAAKYDPKKEFEVAASQEIEYVYADGTRVLCGQAYPGGATFVGEKGTLHVNRGTIKATPADLLTAPLGQDPVRLEVSGSHHGNWLECIRTRKLPICDVEVGHRSATVCHLGNIASRLGRKLAWDPKTEKIANDAEAARMLATAYRAPWVLPLEG